MKRKIRLKNNIKNEWRINMSGMEKEYKFVDFRFIKRRVKHLPK